MAKTPTFLHFCTCVGVIFHIFPAVVIRHSQTLKALVEVLSLSVGSLTSYKKIADTFSGKTTEAATDKTIKRYIDFLTDAFLFEQAKRFDVKGRKYIGGNSKFYAEDVGLRNAILSFRQQEENYIMDNFEKIIIVRDNIILWHNENGVLTIGIFDFLLGNR